MIRRKSGRMVFIASGSKEGVNWNLRFAITEKTESFFGLVWYRGRTTKTKALSEG